MITIRVTRNRDGEPVCGASVYISADAQFMWGGGVRSGRTNDKGEVQIDFSLPCSGKVVVDGQQLYQGELQAYLTVYT
jgi:hypothetical protein